MTTSTLNDNSGTTGEIEVSWTVTTPADFYSYRIYLRENGVSTWQLIYETFQDLSSYSVDIYQFGVGVQQDITVVEVTQPTTGSLAEGTYDDFNTITPAGGDTRYYLIDPNDAANNVFLNHATGDSHADEYEQESYMLLDRGRKVEIGTNLGYSGTLTFTVYRTATQTVRSQALEIETLRNLGTEIYIRSPFGDVWRVYIENLAWDRVAGVGTDDYRVGKLDWTTVV